jgi:hypothetical protein
MADSPWAILLCKFNDDAAEPFERGFYERLFTAAGTGTQNMVDYFLDVSHGKMNVGNSQVFGWYTLDKKRSDYTGNVATGFNRSAIINAAKEKAKDNGVKLEDFFGVVVCMNVPTDLFGVLGGRAAFCDVNSMEPTVLGQEMGHGYGLDHSRADGSDDDYQDRWDTMSTWGSCFYAPHPEYTNIGPGLNAWNMRGREWLEESRVWKSAAAGYDATIELRPLHRRDLPGMLAAEIGEHYLVEFRAREGWDAAIPEPAVLIHRFADNRSYLMRGTSGQQDLKKGDLFEIGVRASDGPYLQVKVIDINAAKRTATLNLVYHPLRVPVYTPIRRLPFDLVIGEAGGVFGGVRVDAGGWIIIGGKVVPVPPWDPTFKFMQQISFFQSGDQANQPWVRDTVRREALTAIVEHANKLLEGLETFTTVAPKLQQRGRKNNRNKRSAD